MTELLFDDPTALRREAIFTPGADGEMYRYALLRAWGDPDDFVLFVMLNPSVASDLIDDNTVEQCMVHARRWGHTAVVVVNLFAFVSTDPRGLLKARDPVGPWNDHFIVGLALAARRIVLAHGRPPFGKTSIHARRAETVLRMLQVVCDGERGVRCLAHTPSGWPHHPLRLAHAGLEHGPHRYADGVPLACLPVPWTCQLCGFTVDGGKFAVDAVDHLTLCSGARAA